MLLQHIILAGIGLFWSLPQSYFSTSGLLHATLVIGNWSHSSFIHCNLQAGQENADWIFLRQDKSSQNHIRQHLFGGVMVSHLFEDLGWVETGLAGSPAGGLPLLSY